MTVCCYFVHAVLQMKGTRKAKRKQAILVSIILDSDVLDYGVFISCISGSLHKDTTQAILQTMLSLSTLSVGHFTKASHKPSSRPCCLYQLYQWVTSQRHHTSHPLDHAVFINFISGSFHKGFTQAILQTMQSLSTLSVGHFTKASHTK